MRRFKDTHPKTRNIHHIRRMDCFTDYVAFAKQIPPKGKRGASDKRDQPHWSGTNDLAEAFELADKGWRAGREMILKYTNQILPTIMSRVAVPEIIHDYSGGSTIDMGRFMEGDPECFYVERESDDVRENAQRNGKVVKIVINFFTSCGYEPQIMTARGAALVALIDALEYSHRRVELWANVACTGISRTDIYETQILIKRPSEPVSPDSIAFALAHPSMFRRVWFAVLEQEPDGEKFGSYGCYGFPAETIMEGDINIPPLNWNNFHKWGTEKKCVEWTLEMLTEQGVKLEEVEHA